VIIGFRDIIISMASPMNFQETRKKLLRYIGKYGAISLKAIMLLWRDLNSSELLPKKTANQKKAEEKNLRPFLI
jgi:hypothetical protein